MRIIGAGGRVGSAVSARLAERGVLLDADDPELVLLCVPDRVIAEVAGGLQLGPWIAHVSGATPLTALDPHVRRFGLHPLQSFSKARGSEQLDGAWGAVTAESNEARTVGFWLGEVLGLRPFELDDANRAAYHAGAAFASNYLVTLRAAAGSLLEAAGAPPEALDPLIRGVIDGGFELTGPIARGDWETVERHLDVIRAERPELEELYLVLAEATASVAGHGTARLQGAPRRESPLKVERTISGLRERLSGRRSGQVGLVPTMGALHEGHLSLLRAARAENETVVMSLFVNPTQFGNDGDLARYPRDDGRDLALAEQAGVDIVFAPDTTEMYPPGFQTWVDVTELGSILEGRFRPGHFRGVATVVLKLFEIVRPRRAYFGQKDAQQAEVIRQMIRDLSLDVELRVLPTVRDEDGLALSSRNALLSPQERERALALSKALATRDPDAALEQLRSSNGLEIDYVEAADFDPPVLAGAVRVGSTRLIDNVVLEGEPK
ncbi:MAG TPA: pantoate--beta-alanine ligase [Gaiellaceae bacterium]|nr:pantoate--beta-alanine ligase [Gaiellaceae bacterium]